MAIDQELISSILISIISITKMEIMESWLHTLGQKKQTFCLQSNYSQGCKQKELMEQ